MSDSSDVLRQCLDSARFILKIKRVFQAQPWGLGSVAEDLGDEVELLEKWVIFPLETDTIPVDFQGVVHFNDCEVRLRFYHPQIRDGKVTYDCEVVNG